MNGGTAKDLRLMANMLNDLIVAQHKGKPGKPQLIKYRKLKKMWAGCPWNKRHQMVAEICEQVGAKYRGYRV